MRMQASDIGHLFGFPISNAMLVTWIVAALLIGSAWLATRKVKDVPDGLQNFWEWIVEGLYGFLEGIVGAVLIRRTFWFFATIFVFVLSASWFGLLPGVGTIGWGVRTAHGFEVTRPLLRSADADFNMTFAMAMIFFVVWLIWALQENGLFGFLRHLFAPKGETTGLLKALMVVVFLAVGVLEVISILVRPVSLSLRLYGNVYAGDNMLETMSRMVPWLGWLLPIPFYLMELLVGLVQAMVFMLLTAVFTFLICQHDETSEHGAHAP